MPGNVFTFCTWNAGSSEADYAQLFAEDKDPRSLTADRNRLLQETASKLAADVFALQEVNGDDRPDIQEFRRRGFQIFRTFGTDRRDTAIAINPEKFRSIQNKSFFDAGTQSDFAIVTAIERATGKKIAFISGWIIGFNLEANLSTIQEQALQGDRSLQTLVSRINEICSDCDTVLVGADMNSTPEIYQHRFKILKTDGFTLHKTASPTSLKLRNADGTATRFPQRELDYIASKTKGIVQGWFKSLFKSDSKHLLEKPVAQLTLTPDSCPSDHLPVFVRVHEVITKQSGINRLFYSICSFFKLLLGLR